MLYWVFGLLPTSRGSNRDSNRRPHRSAFKIHVFPGMRAARVFDQQVQHMCCSGNVCLKTETQYQSGSRFEPGPEVQNRGSNRQLGYGREFDSRRNFDRHTRIFDEMLSTNIEMLIFRKHNFFLERFDPPETRADWWSFFKLSDPVFN